MKKNLAVKAQFQINYSTFFTFKWTNFNLFCNKLKKVTWVQTLFSGNATDSEVYSKLPQQLRRFVNGCTLKRDTAHTAN